MNITVHVVKECLYDKFQKVELLGRKVFTFLRAFVTDFQIFPSGGLHYLHLIQRRECMILHISF